MSLLRQTARRSAAVTAPAASRPAGGRLFHASASKRDAHSHADSQAGEEDYRTHETFSTPFLRNTAILVIGSIVAYRLSNLSANTGAAHQEAREDPHQDQIKDDERPFLTRYIEYWTPAVSKQKEQNDKQLGIIKERAEEKLFIQDAELPPVRRLLFPQRFDMASPHAIPTGENIDTSDIKIKKSWE